MPVTKLSPEEARELVERVGSIKGAARSIGVHRSTFRYWLDPELWKRRHRDAYARNPEKERAQMRRYHENLTGMQYAWTQLRSRRNKALARMRKREERRG